MLTPTVDLGSRHSLSALAVTLALTLHAAPSRAQDAYRALVDEAVQEYDLGHYTEALARFERAYAMRPSARLLRGMAKARFELRQYALCLDAAEAALARPEDLTPAMINELQQLRARVWGYVGTVSFQVTPWNATVTLDGREVAPDRRSQPMRVDVGSHEVVVSSPGYQSARRTLEVSSGGRSDVMVIALHAGGASPVPWIGAALGVLGLGGAVGSALWMVDRTDAVDRCQVAFDQGARCANAEALASERDLAIVALVGSGVVAVAGAITFGLGLRASRSSAPAASVAGAPTVGGGFCAGAIRW